MEKRLSLVSLFCLLIVLFVFPNPASSQLKPGDPIIIGVPTFLGSVDGGDSLKAVIMAAEEINAKGGVTIKGAKHPIKIEAARSGMVPPGSLCQKHF